MHYFKGGVIAVKIMEDGYVDGLDSYKNLFHKRIMMKKGKSSPTINALQGKLIVLWNVLSK